MASSDPPTAGEVVNDERLPYTVVEVNGVREVTQTFTQEGGTVLEMRRAHKVGISHRYRPAGRNEPIPLYAGPFNLTVDEESRGYTGNVQLVWGPRPAILIRGARDELPSVDDIRRIFENTGRMWISPAEFSLPDPSVLPLQPPTYAVGDVPAARDGLSTISDTTNVVRVGVKAGFERLTFLVPNGWEAIDGFEVGDPDNPLRSVGAGLVTSNGLWEVFLHPRLDGNMASRQRDLANFGGFDITHVGEIRRVDGAAFDEAEAWAVTTTLRLCFSIACGRTTTPRLGVGNADRRPMEWPTDRRLAERINVARSKHRNSAVGRARERRTHILQ